MFERYSTQTDQNDRELKLMRMYDEIIEENDLLLFDFDYDDGGL